MRFLHTLVVLGSFFLITNIAFGEVQHVVPGCFVADEDTEYIDDDVEGSPGSSDPTLCLSVGKVSGWEAQFTDNDEVRVPGEKLFDIEVHWNQEDLQDEEGEYILALFSGTINDALQIEEVFVAIEEERGVLENIWLHEEGDYFITFYKGAPYCFSETNCAPDDGVQARWFEDGDLRPLYYTLPPQEWGYFTLHPETAQASSVVFLPGVQGSRLYVKEGDNFDKVWEPSGNFDMRKLYLDMETGESLYDIYIGEVIDSISISGIPFSLGDVYATFLTMLGELERDNIVLEAKALAYDWRFDPKTIAQGSFNYMSGETRGLRNQVLAIANNSPTGKVTIIAHSYGGLVAKEIIKDFPQNKIDTFITLGTPHYGTPKAIPTILHGEGLSKGLGLIMRKSVGRGLAVSTDSAYMLMPFPKYFDLISDPVVSIDEGDSTSYLYTTYGSDITDMSTLKAFVQDTEGRSDPTSDETNIPASIYPRGVLYTHQRILERFWVIDSVRYINFVGWGLDTIKSTKYYTRRKDVCILNCFELDYEPVFTQDGDGTVVGQSAEGGDNGLDEVYYLDFMSYDTEVGGSFRHINMTEFPPLQDVLRNMIEGGEVEENSYISDDRPVLQDPSRRLLVSAHSPVEIQVTDIEGNMTGRKELGQTDFFQIVEEVPGSFYLEFGEGKYIGVDFEDISTITFNGIGSGESTIAVGDMYGGENLTFSNVPTATSSVMTLILSSNLESSTLEVDEDGDGEDDVVYSVANGVLEVSEVFEEKSEIVGSGETVFVDYTLKGKVLGDSISSEELLHVSTQELVVQSEILLKSLSQEIPNEYRSELSTLLDDLERVLIRYTEMYE